MKEALFYRKLEEKKVKCELCPHFCTITDGGRGICGVRENREG
jgi:pyruvate formate lyase activating enzyme